MVIITCTQRSLKRLILGSFYSNGGSDLLKHFVYILECSDGTYYTGYSNDVLARLKKHQEGKGAKYTRGRTPLQLVFKQGFVTKEEALKAEYAIKKLSKQEKGRLILGEVYKVNVDTTELS